MVDPKEVKMQAEHAIELILQKVDEIYDDVHRQRMTLTNEDVRILEKAGEGVHCWLEVWKMHQNV